MFHILLFIHCLLCVLLIGLVLIQQGKGADMGAAWGGSSSSVFGASGVADFLTKFTTSIAISFMVTSVLLVRAYSTFAGSVSSAENPLEGSVMGEVAPPPTTSAPTASTPATTAATTAVGTAQVVQPTTEGSIAPLVEPAIESKKADVSSNPNSKGDKSPPAVARSSEKEVVAGGKSEDKK